MDECWIRIETWLRQHAPPIYAALQPGASEDHIRRAEAQLGVSLPDDMRTSYAIHDGSGFSGLFPFPLLSLNGVVAQWNNWKGWLEQGKFVGWESTPQGAVKTDWWNIRWIPFTHDGGGNHQCLDLDPPDGGNVGQVINFDHEVGATEVLADSFGSFLAAFADDLEAGHFTMSAGGECLDPA
jgi:cell wall assembly regulator SMI1